MTKFETKVREILSSLAGVSHNTREHYNASPVVDTCLESIKSIIKTDGLGKDKDLYNLSHDVRYYEKRGFNSANEEARTNMGIEGEK